MPHHGQRVIAVWHAKRLIRATERRREGGTLRSPSMHRLHCGLHPQAWVAAKRPAQSALSPDALSVRSANYAMRCDLSGERVRPIALKPIVQMRSADLFSPS